MQVKHFTDFRSIGKEEILSIIEMAEEFKRRGYPRDLLRGRCIAMIFEKPSTRTRFAFNSAIAKLGGSSINLSTTEMQLSRGEPILDTAKVLSRYVDVIVARLYSHRTMEELAKYSEVPVVNALTDVHHPTQALADVMTIHEHAGDLNAVKLAYVGDGNNVCNSLLQIAGKLGMHMSVASPPAYSVREDILSEVVAWAKTSNAKIEIHEDPGDAVRGADFVYTDVFVSMGSEAERERRMREFIPRYQVNRTLLSYAKPTVKFMHCMPMYRGEEVTPDVADSPLSLVYEQAENRMHTFGALLRYLLGV
ncbi:MAG: ornithine carbamoyltransferase [Aigarchaeota archaeon]|nr:ornithine carbamoyltransferase [Aigarchaeota archaeon]MDW8092669.1 ornithine carbamoyltransferase [Nitrososphaerota archaeon]